MSTVAKIALIADLGFLAVISVGRILRHRRTTGDSGVRLGARSPAAQLGGGVFFVAILLGVIGLAVAAVTERSQNLNAALVVFGGLIAVGGAAVTIWAQAVMGDSWRIGVDPTETPALIFRGPFRWIRNPIFSGMAATQTGLAVVVPNVWTVAAAAMFIVSIEAQVRLVEEPHLNRSVTGWTKYAAGVGRFLPGVGRRKGTS
jgi:protein-S-isoprenylcysteine O-methyltransferase Ste14